MIDTPEPQIYYRPENCGQSESEKPFVLGHHLFEAWFHSDYALQGQVFSLISDLWENHGKQVEKLDEPAGQLRERLTHWLKVRLENGGFK
ncbi:hypothetical protein [Photorhabdus sp. RM323S]|uniref:hypothetical protein n=1 Tax=Photorhabdus sp. RM323S TaxID=3342828 RepID=UPI0036DE231C